MAASSVSPEPSAERGSGFRRDAEQANAERFSDLQRTMIACARGFARGRVLAPRVALVGLAHAELLAHEQAGIRLERDA